MPREHAEILADIDQFVPIEEDWLPLQALLDELWTRGVDPPTATPVLLRVFERFPTENNGVLYSLLHGLETFEGIEDAVADSMARQPSEMGRVMGIRYQNWLKSQPR